MKNFKTFKIATIRNSCLRNISIENSYDPSSSGKPTGRGPVGVAGGDESGDAGLRAGFFSTTVVFFLGVFSSSDDSSESRTAMDWRRPNELPAKVLVPRRTRVEPTLEKLDGMMRSGADPSVSSTRLGIWLRGRN